MKPIVHCWEDRREHITNVYGYGSDEWVETWRDDWRDGTCMLLEGHTGEHEFTDDECIGVRFG